MSAFPKQPAIRREAHFEQRVVQCYAQRPPNLYAMLAAAAERYPDRLALVCESQRLTWRELDRNVESIAAGLIAKGMQKGERVAILIGNRAEFVEAALAISRLGGIMVPISTREQAPGIAHILSDSGAAMLIYEKEAAERLPAMIDVPQLRELVALDDASGDSFASMRTRALKAPPAAVDEEETAAILYTSGTTGKPKGAMLTHLNIVHSAMHYQYTIGLSEEDRFIAAVPLSHVTGLVALMAAAMRCAAALIVMPVFKASAFLELAARERMTYTLMVPAMYNLCLIQSDCAGFDLSAWRIGAFGGAIMPEPTIAAVAKFLPNLTLINVYGATETASPVTVMPHDAGIAYIDSVGKAVPCGEIAIMDDEGREVPAGSAGELWIRGPMVVKGYWNNPAATASGFVAGYWKSGDIGSLDEQGFVRIFDRKKDMINRGGFKIYSSEVENVLCEHPAIFEAAVVGVPCPVLGERVHAYIAIKEGKLTEEELKVFCAARLTDYQVPERFMILQAPLPRNPNGKILKRELRTLAA